MERGGIGQGRSRLCKFMIRRTRISHSKVDYGAEDSDEMFGDMIDAALECA